jgi:hypothetical protein
MTLIVSLTGAFATLRGGKVIVESVGASSRRRFAPRPRRVPGLLNAPHRGVDDSNQAYLNAEPGILVGEFAVGIMGGSPDRAASRLLRQRLAAEYVLARFGSPIVA